MNELMEKVKFGSIVNTHAPNTTTTSQVNYLENHFRCDSMGEMHSAQPWVCFSALPISIPFPIYSRTNAQTIDRTPYDGRNASMKLIDWMGQTESSSTALGCLLSTQIQWCLCVESRRNQHNWFIYELKTMLNVKQRIRGALRASVSRILLSFIEAEKNSIYRKPNSFIVVWANNKKKGRATPHHITSSTTVT